MNECTDIDECDMGIQFCGNRHCINTVGSYTCLCREGFDTTKSVIDPTCIDIDECSKRNTCPRNSICQNNLGSFECLCDKGFWGQSCLDIDECSANLTNCHVNAECLNLEGSYKCECKEGFYGNGITCLSGTCKDSGCPENKECVSPRKFDCQCKKGFLLKSDGSCIDIDECSTEKRCHSNATCMNMPGSYQCRCMFGFHGDGTSCLEGDCIDDYCDANERCLSPQESVCECKEGFSLDENGDCVDINECSSQSNCDVNAGCYNSEGSFICECRSGYYGSGIKCAKGQCHDGSCPPNQKCISPTGTQCECLEGFERNEDDQCTDINECASNNHKCSKALFSTRQDRKCESNRVDLTFVSFPKQITITNSIEKTASKTHVCFNTDGRYFCKVGFS